uniref:Response regulator transcription factor n=1 Tax=Desulfatirhabdium butyrativorans TaxID=340467 RepID=A0A7C4MST0_9BACT
MTIKVFLADDHTVVRDGLRMLLEAGGDIQVVGQAADGLRTVQEVQRLEPDVVVMDISMPHMDGIEATRRILRSCPKTGVVILSVHATSEHIFQALRSGAKGYLLKESAGEEVVQAVRAVHSGLHYFSNSITEIMIQEYIQLREISSKKSPLERLSDREHEILKLLANGKSNAEIAAILHLSVKSVETYRSRMMQKLGIRDLASLVKFAIQHGLTSLHGHTD